MTPLLSICIPTFNRGDFLKVMLEALLHQVAEVAAEVEVIVLDNASSDDTDEVVRSARQCHDFRYVKHPENLGPIENVVQGPRDHAFGTYSWVLGHHNLLRPDALPRVLETLRAYPDLDVFYANFRCATYPEHWPETAMGGYDGEFSYLGNPRTEVGLIDHWLELVQAQSALCTQVYAHIVRTNIWRDYWCDRPIPPPYTSGISTYPHPWMLAETCLHSKACYIKEPVLTIFNGAQSWGDLPTRLKVYTIGMPELLLHYRRNGMSREQVADARVFGRRQLEQQMKLQFAATPSPRHHRLLLHTTLKLGLRNRWLWSEVWRAYLDSKGCPVARAIQALSGVFRRTKQYCLHDCRPARWLRKHRRGPDRRHAG